MKTVDELTDVQYEILYEIAEDIEVIHWQAMRASADGGTEVAQEAAESQRTAVEDFHRTCKDFDIDMLTAWEEFH
ncbi:hypothetical protein ACWFMI_14960 [Nocardiopsis terrae]